MRQPDISHDCIRLYHADCMDIMAQYPDKYFDICLTSPPYNMNLRVNHSKDGYCSRQIIKEFSSKYLGYEDNLPMEEYRRWMKSVIKELLRISKLSFFNIQIITGNKPAVFSLLGEFSGKIKELIIWDKGAGQPAIGKGVLNSCFELILVLSDDDSITRAFNADFRGTVDNIFRITPRQSANTGHGATFPIDLAGYIFSTFGKKNDKVIEPFLGTGTSAIAAHYAKMGEFVGVELDADYFKAAAERIYKETRQAELF